MTDGERSLAIFIDFENLALGFSGRRDRFDIARVLERLVEKGKIVAKKSYADWSRFQQFTQSLHECAIELIEIPRRGMTGKNSADIRLCVDAMDLAYSKDHIDTFVVLSGDSDFSPLVSKLKELGKHVIGLGMQDSTSELLRDNCDEFIYYEDLGQAPSLSPSIDAKLPEMKRKAFGLLLESLLALRRENKEVLWSSMIKDTMKRKKPSFNETYHGYRTFSELLEDAQREGLLELETDKRSRTYVVTRFGGELDGAGERPAPARPAARPPSPLPDKGPPAARAPLPLPDKGPPPPRPVSPPPERPVVRPVVALPENAPPRPVAAPLEGAGAGATAVPGKKKGRRRRRRGSGNGNGEASPVAVPAAAGPSTSPRAAPPPPKPVTPPPPPAARAEPEVVEHPRRASPAPFDAGLTFPAEPAPAPPKEETPAPVAKAEDEAPAEKPAATKRPAARARRTTTTPRRAPAAKKGSAGESASKSEQAE